MKKKRRRRRRCSVCLGVIENGSNARGRQSGAGNGVVARVEERVINASMRKA